MTQKEAVATAASDREIVISRSFNAPRELVYKAFTDSKYLASWWGPRGFRTTTFEMEVKTGGKWRFIMHGPDGMDYPNLIVYREIVPNEQLVYSQSDGDEEGENAFQAVVTFEEDGSGRTRVTLRMVFKTREARDFVVEHYGAIEGGHQTLERLGDHLTHFAPDTFVISRTFAAPRDLVFQAWTEPERIAQWFGPKGCKVQVESADIRADGMIHIRLEMGGVKFWSKWIIRDLVVPERLVFLNCFADAEGGLGRHPFDPTWPLQILTSVAFEEKDGSTTVTVYWTPVEETPEERRTFAAEHEAMREGWGGTLEKLEKHLAEGTARQ